MKVVRRNKDKGKVLAEAKKNKIPKVSLWRDSEGFWHAAHGPQHVPNYATEVEHIS